MLLAWPDAQLEGCCVDGSRLLVAAGSQLAAAEDLLHLVAHALDLGSLQGFRSIAIGVREGSLVFSIEEVDMYARPLTSAGEPRSVASLSSLRELSRIEALLVQDLHVHGRSMRRLAS